MTQNTSPTTTSASTSLTSQRGDVPSHDEYVQEQYEFCKREGECAYNRKVVERALKFARMTKNHAKLNAKAVLDVGCRDGFATATLEAELDGVRIVGIDIVPQFVKLAQLVSDEIYEMDAHDLKFKDGEFDYVFSSHTLEHCYDHMKALSEMKRVASKGLYLALPLEPEDSMHDNHSHYFSTVDPLVWANKIDDDKWMVTGVEMSDFCDVIITAMPRTLLDFDKIHTNYKEKTS